MSPRTISKSEADGQTTTDVTEPAPVVFGEVRFTSPILQVVQRTLAPYVHHQAPCDGVTTCSCGLQAAIVDLERREMMAKRYGSAEG